jgi:glycosyltransferase involved in cell wall biosynthesis
LSYASHLSIQPLVSVVIPAYNRLPFLQHAVSSVIAQTYTNWELLVVDDGSTDGTKEVIQSLGNKRIHVFSVPHCGNIAVLRNAGVAAGSGEWIAFLDSDDIWVPEKLELQLLALQQQQGLWGYGGFELMDEKGRPISNRPAEYVAFSGWITKELLTNKASVSIGSLMVKRKLFEELDGFDSNPELIFREDYELALRLSLKAKATAVPGLLVKVREHQGRSTNHTDDGNKRTAYLYGHFITTCTDRKLKRIARRRQAYHETEMAVKSTGQKKYGQAALLFGKAFFKGDQLRHLFSALGRSMKTNK